jgi:hypothetical protein
MNTLQMTPSHGNKASVLTLSPVLWQQTEQRSFLALESTELSMPTEALQLSRKRTIQQHHGTALLIREQVEDFHQPTKTLPGEHGEFWSCWR